MDTLLFNPHAGSIKKNGTTGEDLLSRLSAKGVDAELVHSDEPIDLHADALPAGQAPAVIEVLPGCLEVSVPEETT